MPIDFAAVAARFGEQIAAQPHQLMLTAEQIRRVLIKRRDAARAVEGATRMFPIIRFEDGAVAVTLAASERGLLELSTPPPGFGAQIVAGGAALLGGLSNAWAPFGSDSQEGALGRFATSFDRALADLVASIERFEAPRREMFDPRATSGGDLVGLAALAWRTLVDASARGGDIMRFTAQVRSALSIARGSEGASARSGGLESPAPEAPQRSTSEFADVATSVLGGGVIVLGVLPELLEQILSAVWIRARAWVLDQLMGIEGAVLALRETLLRDATEGVIAFADQGIDIALAIQQIVGENIAFMLRFWRRIGTAFLEAVRDFVVGLGRFLSGLVEIMKTLPDVIAALTGFDLAALIGGTTAQFGVHVTAGQLTLDSLLDKDGRSINVGKAAHFWDLLDTAQAKVDDARRRAWPFFGEKFDKADRQIRRARRLVNELFPGWSGPGPHLIEIPAEGRKLDFKSNFPNLTELLFDPSRTSVVAFIEKLGRLTEFGTGEALRRARDRFGRLGVDFSREARSAAALGSESRYEHVRDAATGLAEAVFGDEVRAARARVSEPQGAGRALESWLAGGGFELIGQAIPAYVGELARHWYAQVEHGEEPTAPVLPTSPRILREHATVGRVALPRLSMHVPSDRALDAELADEVADRFALEMRAAYESSRRKLAELAALPGS